MRKPDESLDAYVVRAVTEELAEPPRPVLLRFTGEVEVLKPLARGTGWKRPSNVEVLPAAFVSAGPNGLSWFHRSLVAGGAFAVGAFILASAIFIGMYDGAASQSELADVPEVTEIAEADAVQLPSEEPIAADTFTTPNSELRTPRSAIRNRTTPRSPFRSRRVLRSAPRTQQPALVTPSVEPFVPTTLIIYIDQGEVKTRIEPQLTASYKKTPTLSN